MLLKIATIYLASCLQASFTLAIGIRTGDSCAKNQQISLAGVTRGCDQETHTKQWQIDRCHSSLHVYTHLLGTNDQLWKQFVCIQGRSSVPNLRSLLSRPYWMWEWGLKVLSTVQKLKWATLCNSNGVHFWDCCSATVSCYSIWRDQYWF